jgi:hypothetical protein
MKFGAKTEAVRCSRCMRTKEEAIEEQKNKGHLCPDTKCVFKQEIQNVIKSKSPKIPIFCSYCGRKYNSAYSKFCDKCGKKRNLIKI